MNYGCFRLGITPSLCRFFGRNLMILVAVFLPTGGGSLMYRMNQAGMKFTFGPFRWTVPEKEIPMP